MTVIDITKGLDNATLTVDASFDAPIDKVWQLYADPRKLERWWGPPSYPATVTRHELVPGGTVAYFMTGPEGATYHGLWELVEVDELRCLEVVDFFADAEGNVNPALPSSRMRLEFTEAQGRTLMHGVSTFDSAEDLRQTLEMGMEEGLRQAMGQMDALLV